MNFARRLAAPKVKAEGVRLLPGSPEACLSLEGRSHDTRKSKSQEQLSCVATLTCHLHVQHGTDSTEKHLWLPIPSHRIGTEPMSVTAAVGLTGWNVPAALEHWCCARLCWAFVAVCLTED